MKPWDRAKGKAQLRIGRIEGKWLDVGVASCPYCRVERRLYRPVSRLDIYACAPCTQRASLRDLDDTKDQQEVAA